MDITFPALTTLNNGVQMTFNDQLYAAPSIYKMFSMDVESSGDAEVYPRLDMLPGVREWIGSRLVYSLSQETFTIPNRTFEETIGVRREQLEDDKYGLLTPAVKQLGMDAGQLPDKLIAALMVGGTGTTWVDGQDFFSATHVSFPNTSSIATNSNYQAGSSTSWYLVDNSHALKPFIFQRRRPFVITPRFSMTDPSVFDNNEFLWGTDGRCAAGYGLYQLVFRSDAALTLANLIAARTAMAAWKRPDGTPMGITPTHLIAPPSLYPSAKAYAENEFLPPGDPVVPAGGTVANTFRGMVQAVENRWLS